jgi:predicted nucleotidyltransferase
MKKAEIIQRIKSIFSEDKQVGLAYLFGSIARNDIGPLSDIDLAVYLDESLSKSAVDKHLDRLYIKVSRALQNDNIDLVLLNTVEQPELAYAIIAEGQLLFDREPYKVVVEPKIMNQYFDFRFSLERHGLTKVHS